MENFQTVLFQRCSSEVGIDLCCLCKSHHAHSHCSPRVLAPLDSVVLYSPNTIYIPSRHPQIHSIWVPPLYVLEPVFAVRFLLRNIGSKYHVFLTGIFLRNAFLTQKSCDFCDPYTFVHPQGRAGKGSNPEYQAAANRDVGCLFHLKSFTNQSKNIDSAGSTGNLVRM